MSTICINIHIENGILFCVVNTNMLLDLEGAKTIISKRLSVCDGKSFPTLFDYGKTKYANKEVRDYLTKEGAGGITAAAFYVDNFATKILIDCYLVVYKPPMPTKIFSDKKQAVLWLEKFIQQ